MKAPTTFWTPVLTFWAVIHRKPSIEIRSDFSGGPEGNNTDIATYFCQPLREDRRALECA